MAEFPFVYGGSLTLTDVGETETLTFRTPTDAPLLVEHLDFTLYNNEGGIDESLALRNEVAIQIVDRTTNRTYFNQAMDVFVLRRLCRSTAFAPFVLPAKTELEISATVTTYVNAGAMVAGTTSYKLNIAFVGNKVQLPSNGR